jgi:hypothetical protein
MSLRHTTNKGVTGVSGQVGELHAVPKLRNLQHFKLQITC